MNINALKSRRSAIVLICAALISISLYYAYQVFALDEKDIFEIIIFPLLLQPFIIVMFIEIWNIIKDSRDEDKIKIRLNKKQLLEKYNQEEIVRGKDFSTSFVPLFVPKKGQKFSLENIHCELDDLTFKIPKIISDQAQNILKAHRQSCFFNGQTLSLRNTKTSWRGKLNLQFIYSDYLAHCLTNLGADVLCLPPSFTVRDILEPGPKLNSLQNTQASNHLGLSALLITSDQKLIIPRRGNLVSMHKKKLSPSISGALSGDISFNDKGEIDLRQVLQKECDEELSPKIVLDKIFLLGLGRELDRLGKPEIFFYAQCKESEKEISNKVKNNPDFKKENTQLTFVAIDENKENILEMLQKGKNLSTPLFNALALYYDL